MPPHYQCGALTIWATGQFIIFLNGVFPFNNNILDNNFTKIIFITHSDVAYSNYFIEQYYKFFYKIITVNNYTIEKLSTLLHINKNN